MVPHLFKNPQRSSIIVINSAIKRRITANRPETKPHGGIGVRIEVTVGIHPANSRIKQPFILFYALRSLHDGLVHIIIRHQQINAQRNGWIIQHTKCCITLQIAFQSPWSSYLGASIQSVDIGPFIAVIQRINRLIHRWQIFRRNLFTIFFQKCSKHIFIDRKVQIVIFLQ